jgi:hypothetical protein
MSKSANKDTRLIFRVSPHDKISIINKAKRAKMSLSEFCRKAVLGKEVKHVEGLDIIIYDLDKIGTNINQIAIAANQGRDVEPTMAVIKKRMLKTLDKIDNALDGGDDDSDSQTD